MTLPVHQLGRRAPATLVYLTALGAVGLILACSGARWQAAVVAAASTNLHNLGTLHLSTLASSALVIDEGPVWFTCLGVGCTLAVAELAWGARRMVTTFLVGHVGATLLVAGGLWVGITSGWLPLSWERASDVGVSYGVFAVLTALSFSLPRGWRLPWALVWLTLAVQGLLIERSFTSVGHCLAGVVGIGVGWWLLKRGTAKPAVHIMRPVRLLLLAGAALFGLCIIGWDSPGWWSAPVVAAVVMLACKSRPVHNSVLHLSCAPRRWDASPAGPAASVVDAVPVPTRRPAPASRRQ